MRNVRLSIGRERAIALAESEWWKGVAPRRICEFQLFTAELSMDFSAFHAALEACLKRPIWTHEFGLNYDGLVDEFLGRVRAPSLDEIMALIPAHKAIVVCVPGEGA